MDNSSKALLITAAILITITIITLSISILKSNNRVSESANESGEKISVTADKVSDEITSTLNDLDNNLIKVKNRKIEFTNKWYENYFPTEPKLLLNPNTTYVLSFDYKINYADDIVGCGIGYGEFYYKTDIIYSVIYPNQTAGKFIKTFSTPNTFNTDKPYLQLRFARMDNAGKLSVEIKNIKFKKK